MDLSQIVGLVLEHGPKVLEIAIAVCGVASLVTGLTKTPGDDKIVGKIRGVLDRLSVLTHKNAKGTLKLPGAKSEKAE